MAIFQLFDSSFAVSQFRIFTFLSIYLCFQNSAQFQRLPSSDDFEMSEGLGNFVAGQIRRTRCLRNQFQLRFIQVHTTRPITMRKCIPCTHISILLHFMDIQNYLVDLSGS